MTPTITNKRDWYKYFFRNYETRKEFIEKGKAAADSLNRKYDGDEINSFKNQRLLKDAISFFEEMMTKINMGGAFEKSRLRITDDPRGVFSFSLASKGLYRPQEYYSAELAVDSPEEFPNEVSGVVPFTHVKEVKDLKQFWYTSLNTGKKYLLTKQQEGTRAVALGLQKNLKFRTTTKKSFVMFEKKGGKAKLVDLYIPFSASASLNQTAMLVRIMPMILVAKYLESVQIRTKVSMARMYSGDIPGSYITVAYPIKDYGDDTDYDYIAANCADERWFRGDLWVYVGAILAKEERNRNFEGYGTPTVSYNEVLEVFNRYKNWYFEDMKLGNQQEIRVDRNLMLAGGLQEPSNSFRSNTDAIKVEFFRVLDIVDFQFNQPEKAAERIFKRMVEDEKKTVYEFKSYVQKTLADAYSYPTKGQYATEPERREILEEDFDKALDGLNKYLESKGE